MYLRLEVYESPEGFSSSPSQGLSWCWLPVVQWTFLLAFLENSNIFSLIVFRNLFQSSWPFKGNQCRLAVMLASSLSTCGCNPSGPIRKSICFKCFLTSSSFQWGWAFIYFLPGSPTHLLHLPQYVWVQSRATCFSVQASCCLRLILYLSGQTFLGSWAWIMRSLNISYLSWASVVSRAVFYGILPSRLCRS